MGWSPKRCRSSPGWRSCPTFCASTIIALPAHTTCSWWMEQIFPMYRRSMKVARPLMRAVTDAPMPPDGIFASVLDLFHRLDHLHHTLVDPQLTSVRLVLNPEKMVVAEAQRTYTYLSLFGYPTDLVVANRIVPGDVIDSYFAALTRRAACSQSALSRQWRL